MRIHRFLSLTDLVVGVVVLVALFLPRRPLYALDAYKLEPEARADLGAAEARWMLHPESALAAQAFSRQLVEAGQIDWAVEVPRDTAAVAAPDERWRAALSVSEAYIERVQVEPALDWAQQAEAGCKEAGARCPSWELLKLELYLRYLKAGVKSGIDPRRDPDGFQRAAGDALHTIDIRGA
ncbi:MAG: hypothetical protein KC464_09480, partial [Myxococcales bacterium]|nr:hypothetical protein [Myxococcales bacterium]